MNSLSKAFNQRSTAAKNSHGVHKVSLGTFALSNALEQGSPFASEAEALKQSNPDDRLISAVVDTLPSRVAQQV